MTLLTSKGCLRSPDWPFLRWASWAQADSLWAQKRKMRLTGRALNLVYVGMRQRRVP